ncbi:beta-N-acetylglucosaminidase domain-containing protein [Actinospongicola halichondriae]|uniref:beta-N-acetylglucosaminidase domain-containing protein n=1 Tax=Actinospongicola halichondriae TaxID=3236844 RepID=UPI003D4F7DC2
MTEPAPRPWLAALEGYYGRPLDPAERIDLVRWLATVGYDAYVHAPKNDPYQRDQWRDAYPDDALAGLAEVSKACRDAGLGFGLTISPGLDWEIGSSSDVDDLVAKVESLLPVGLDVIGIAWDDTPGAGEALGRDHAAAVATVADRVGRSGVRWFTCPVDYAVSAPTPYLAAFAEALGDGIEIMWTGPSVVTADLAPEPARSLAASLGRPVLFAENFPVNDVGMSPALHLGPYPHRASEAMAAVTGNIVNFMSRPLASRVGLELAARAWLDPTEDRAVAWSEVVEGTPGLAPLARACRAWLDEPGPDPELVAWAEAAGPDDRRLHDFLDVGCRDGLAPALAAEVEPWLEAWDREAAVMRRALAILEVDVEPTFESVATLALAWRAAQAERRQVFGTRFAIYPSTLRRDGDFLARADAIVREPNLTDLLVDRVLGVS